MRVDGWLSFLAGNVDEDWMELEEDDQVLECSDSECVIIVISCDVIFSGWTYVSQETYGIEVQQKNC